MASIADSLRKHTATNRSAEVEDIYEGTMDIIAFAESPYGLNQPLFPVQKFVFKLFYHLPLSDNLS